MRAVKFKTGMTQEAVILEHLRKNPKQGITDLDAARLYCIMRLGWVVYNLRQKGEKILTTPEQSKARRGVYARYTLVKEGGKA